MNPERLDERFFSQDAVTVARLLLGKTLVRVFPDGSVGRYRITETEAYLGEEDKACHASKGRTPRTEVMYHKAGKIYVYLIYGMYWMLNFVTSEEGHPSAVLIRGIEGFSGPGRVGRELKLDKSFYGEVLQTSQQIWVEDGELVEDYLTSPRIGVDYAGSSWAQKHWRFFIQQ